MTLLLDITSAQPLCTGPGYSADAFVDRDTGSYKLSETKMGVVAILNDLHKGRDTGSNWSWVIDGSTIVMTLISGTGLILLLFLKKGCPLNWCY